MDDLVKVLLGLNVGATVALVLTIRKIKRKLDERCELLDQTVSDLNKERHERIEGDEASSM